MQQHHILNHISHFLLNFIYIFQNNVYDLEAYLEHNRFYHNDIYYYCKKDHKFNFQSYFIYNLLHNKLMDQGWEYFHNLHYHSCIQGCYILDHNLNHLVRILDNNMYDNHLDRIHILLHYKLDHRFHLLTLLSNNYNLEIDLLHNHHYHINKIYYHILPNKLHHLIFY